nr:synaptobrevin, longin-like domain protein [Tanacetum cinerariifolium]
MANLTFADTHNMIAFLYKSDASAGFDQIVDLLNAQVIHYALMVNPTIFVSCIKQFWATKSIKKTNDVMKLQALIERKKVVITEDIIRQVLRLDNADGVECLPTEEIFTELERMGYEKPPPNLTFYKAFFSTQWKFLIHTLVQCRRFNFSKYIFDSMVRNVDSPSKFLMIGKGFSGIETPLFATMLVQPQVAAEEEDTEDEVAALEQDKVAQAFEIFKLKRKVKRLEKKRRIKHFGLNSLRKVDVDEDITQVDMEIKVDLDADLQGRIKRKDDVNATDKEVNVVEPTVFNDEPEWSRYVTIVHQTKDLHTYDYTQLYDFLKYNQKEVDELKAERLAK